MPKKGKASTCPGPDSPASTKPTGSRAVGEIWWDNLYNKAKLKTPDGGVELSTPPFIEKDVVMVVFTGGKDDIYWTVPHLIPDDLRQLAKGGSLPKAGEPSQNPPKKPKAQPKKKIDKPVPDYEHPSIRAKYSSQGKNPPIIKIECREDRFDLESRRRQKLQITIKDEITPQIAGNVARTFVDAYEFMTLNPRLLNFKECRDALLGYTEHDWSKAPLKWEVIADLCLDGFPTK